MIQVVSLIRQTPEQKEYYKRLGIDDINKVRIKCYSICPHCGKEIEHEEQDVTSSIPGFISEDPEINLNGGWA